MTDNTKTSQELLDAADRAFDAGNQREGSRLMWEAVRTGIAAVAAKHGLPCGTTEELRAVILKLDDIDKSGDHPGKYAENFAKFGVAEIFLEHAETDKWEYPEFKWAEPDFRTGRKSMKRFVASLMNRATTENNSG